MIRFREFRVDLLETRRVRPSRASPGDVNSEQRGLNQTVELHIEEQDEEVTLSTRTIAFLGQDVQVPHIDLLA